MVQDKQGSKSPDKEFLMACGGGSFGGKKIEGGKKTRRSSRKGEASVKRKKSGEAGVIGEPKTIWRG